MSGERWVSFVSRRFTRRDRTKIMLITAVAVSVATLISVLSIMNGLQFITISNLIHIESYHLVIQEALSDNEQEEIREVLTADGRFESVVAFADLQTIAHSDESKFHGITIRAIDQNDAVRDQRFIEQLNVVRGTFDLSANHVLIGLRLARALQVFVGDSFQIFGHNGQIQPFMVSGLFQSGYPPFDSGLVIMNIERARDAVNRAAVVHIGLKYRNERDEPVLIPAVEEQVAGIIGRNPTLVNWQASNGAIFSALKLEKIFIIFILGMIFIIVAINIRQSLARKVWQKSRELAILKAMGGEVGAVQRVVTYMGVYIGLSGGVIGVVVGLWISINVGNIFRIAELTAQTIIRLFNSIIILLPNSSLSPLPYISSIFFFVNAAPQRLLVVECVAIFLFAVIVSSGAAYAASRRTTTVRPIEALRRKEH